MLGKFGFQVVFVERLNPEPGGGICSLPCIENIKGDVRLNRQIGSKEALWGARPRTHQGPS